MKKIAIIGYGGFAREIGCCIENQFNYFVLDKNYDIYKNNKLILPMSKLDISKYKILVAVGNPILRKKITMTEIPLNAEYYTFIDKFAHILDKETINIGEGSIICAGTILTTNVKIGNHAILNPNTTIGHDTQIGDYFTSSPGVNIAGCCQIGNCNTYGIATSVKDNINICDNVILGLNTGVVKNITESGTYIGTPAKKITYNY